MSSLFPRQGVSLQVLQDLAALPEIGDDFTTADVCFKYIVPQTTSKSCSYVDLLLTKGPDSQALVGPANAFVSHAWFYNFKDTIANLVTNFNRTVPDKKDHKDIFLWMDIVSVNQHNGGAHGGEEDYWFVAFSNAIASMDRVFFVFDSWSDPYPLRRVWCLWEIMTAIQCEWLCDPGPWCPTTVSLLLGWNTVHTHIHT